ncbi:SymE family type I addiction module toxin [Pantoea stewartii]|uniref:SymE family type I addiction module toxin n=1 Tax=Pantoea stewartii TaxID=66269 RepID=UPI00198270A7|nr:SymE family type I addiction module toxin [Pantoea stewartii]
MTTMQTSPKTHPNTVSFKKQRRYTVGYVPKFGDTSTPALNLCGKWLREVGFETGTRVTAEISQGRIVLEVEA